MPRTFIHLLYSLSIFSKTERKFAHSRSWVYHSMNFDKCSYPYNLHSKTSLIMPLTWRDQFCGMCLPPHGLILILSLLSVFPVNFKCSKVLIQLQLPLGSEQLKTFHGKCSVLHRASHPRAQCYVVLIRHVRRWQSRHRWMGGQWWVGLMVYRKDLRQPFTEWLHPFRISAWITYFIRVCKSGSVWF